jgi:hypothetical protein
MAIPASTLTNGNFHSFKASKHVISFHAFLGSILSSGEGGGGVMFVSLFVLPQAVRLKLINIANVIAISFLIYLSYISRIFQIVYII